jgi:cytochrome c oxidase subunit 2
MVKSAAELDAMMPSVSDWMPPIASAHGAQIDASLNWVHVLMAVLFVGWIGFFFVALYRFRASRHPVADPVGARSHASSWLEGAVAAAEGILLVGLAVPLWGDRVKEFPPENEATVVRLVGEQFAWNVHYPGPDGIFGKTAIDKIDLQSNPLGIDRSDPNAKDDVTTLNQLHLPVGKPVIVHLSAKDVIHSFNVPEMRIKQDAVPGIEIPLWWVPTVTTAAMRQQLGKPEFVYEIACAQLCGLGHATMRGFVTVEEPADFQKWMDEQVAAAQTTEDEIWQ